jgi:predicted nucleic acid-binding Zn ribbon protein
MNEKICKECKEPFTPKHGNQVYCGDGCAAIAHLNQKRDRQQEKRKGKLNYALGTGNLPEHTTNDWDKEIYKIQKEMRNLNLI